MESFDSKEKLCLISLAMVLFLILMSSTALAIATKQNDSSAGIYAYITNAGSDNISVISIATNDITTINIEYNDPYGVAVSPDGSNVYVTHLIDSGIVSVINTSNNTVTATVRVGSYPYGVAINPEGTRVYVTNYGSNNVSVIDTATNKVTDTINVGRIPLGIVVSPDGTKVYIVNQESDDVSVINTTTNNVTNVSVGNDPGGIAVNPNGTMVYVTHLGNPGTVSVIDTSINKVTDTVNVESYPVGVAVTPDGTKVYITNTGSDTISVIDTATNNVVDTVNVGAYPFGVAVSPDGTEAYVANWKTNNVSVINTTTNTVKNTINVGSFPIAFGQFIGYIPEPPVATKKVAVIPAKFSNSNTISSPSLVTLINRTDLIKKYYQEQSYGEEYIDFVFYECNTESDKWFNLSYSISEFEDTFPKWSDPTNNFKKRTLIWKEASEIAGIDIYSDSKGRWQAKDYDTVLVLFPVDFKSESYRNDSYAICDASESYGNWAHELGHSLYDLKDKGGDRQVEGNIDNWGLMGMGYGNNPCAPIIGFEKNNKSWLKYKDINLIFPGMTLDKECKVLYLDDSKLKEEGLLRLSTAPGSLVKYFIFEGRRDQKDKQIVIYEVTEKNEIYRIYYVKSLKVDESTKICDNYFKVTCSAEGDDLKILIEPSFTKGNVLSSSAVIRAPHSSDSPTIPNQANIDVDLHIVSGAGKHVGVNYTNNAYEVEIDGVETSGNILGGGPEWIFVPENIDARAYVTVSPDLESLLKSDDSLTVEVASILTVYDENGNMEKSEPISVNINSENLKDQFPIPLTSNSPAGITDLLSTSDFIWIKWTWTNPMDPDFNYTEIYLDGIFQTNTSAEFFNATGLEPETSYTLSTRTVSDNGNVNETWVNSTATTLKAPIVVEAGSDQIIEEGASVNFEGSFTASGSHTYSHHWDFGDISEEDSSLITSHTYSDDGAYTVNLTVTDENGDFGNDTLLVTVNNVIPVVNVGSDLEVTAGDSVSFTGDFSDPGWLDTHTAEWNFGEGTVKARSVSEENEYPDSTGTVSGSFGYFDAGKYTVTLNISDDDGGVGQDQLTVAVLPIKAEVTFDPETFYLNSTGDWVTAYIELPAGYDVSGIDISSVLMNSTVPAVSDPKYDFVTNESEYLTDLDLDGISERMFKFNRGDVARILKVGDKVTVTFAGKVEYDNGVSSGMASFEGSDIIKVAKKDSKK